MLAVLGTMLGVRVWMVESLHASPQLSLVATDISLGRLLSTLIICST
jgi:hypothetical protein